MTKDDRQGGLGGCRRVQEDRSVTERRCQFIKVMKYLRRRCRFFLRPRLAKLAAQCWLRVNHQVDGPTSSPASRDRRAALTLGWEGGEAGADFCHLGSWF